VREECKLTEKRNRIRAEAARLTVERGYGGFTMDDLAERVGVSRRTLFNTVPDKESAVLGMELDFGGGEESAVFRAGGPQGRLVADLLTLFEAVMLRLSGTDTQSASRTAANHVHFTEAISADPRVLAMANARARRHEQDVTALIAEREGWDPEDLRAHALAATVGTLVRVAFEETSRRCGAAPLVQVFRETVEAFVAATQDTARDTAPPATIEV
jgi:AcrR family transcriptional regulator